MNTLITKFISKCNYNIFSDQYFSIFNNNQIIGFKSQSLLIGDYNEKSTIYSEFYSNFEYNKNKGFGNLLTATTSLHIIEKLNSLFVGTDKSSVFEFSLCRGKSMHKLISNYKNIGIGSILAMSHFMHYLILGGDNCLIKIINLRKKKIDIRLIQTSVEIIFSLGVFENKNWKNILIICGKNTNYTQSKTDLFEIFFDSTSRLIKNKKY